MRELTEEEIKLAPDSCDHYNIIDDKVYFTDVLGVVVFDVNGVEIDNCIMDNKVFLKSVPLPEKTFDITKHELVDYGYMGVKCDKNLYVKKNGFTIDKERAIAIALALGVTAGDLK